MEFIFKVLITLDSARYIYLTTENNHKKPEKKPVEINQRNCRNYFNDFSFRRF